MQVNLGMKKIIDLQNKKELIEALFYKICIQVLIIFKELSLLNQAINNYFYRPTPTPNGEWAGLWSEDRPSPGDKWSVGGSPGRTGHGEKLGKRGRVGFSNR